jgi:hypothetical protein
MTQTTINNGHQQRKTLSTQLDRLDTILDGLAEALNESVASAVRDVVGEVVKESVEATIREVLSNPSLLHAALAKHMPVAQVAPTPVPQRRSLKEVLKNALASLLEKGCQAASKAKQKLGTAWSWATGKLRRLLTLGQMTLSSAKYAWKCRKTVAIALSAGILCGAGVYYAGPVIASVVCGLSSAVMTAGSIVLMPFLRLIYVTRTSD